MNFFNQQLEIGKSGEAVVSDWLQKRGNKIKDVSDDREYQRRDIDLVVTNKDGEEITFEVKTDNNINRSKNLFFESTRYKDWGDVEGWFEYCQADYIAFYDVIGNKLYIYNFKDGKQYVRQTAENRLFFNKKDGYWRQAYLLSIGLAKNKGLCKEYEI